MNSTYVMNDDVLKLILSYLPLNEKLKLQRVSQQFNYCVNELLQSQRGLSIGNFLNHCDYRRHSTINGDFSNLMKEQIFNLTSNRDKLLPLFSKCSNLKCLELANCRLDEETIAWLKSLFPKLECLRIESTITNINEDSWPRIGVSLSDSLIHLYIYGHYLEENSITQLCKHLPNLQELSVKNYKYNFGLLFKNLESKINKISLINCNHLNGDDIQFLLDKNVEYFTVQNCNDSEEVFNAICHKMINIKKLSLRFYSFGDSLGRLRFLTKLESLTLRFYSETFLRFWLLRENQLLSIKTLILDTCKLTLVIKLFGVSNIHLISNYLYLNVDLSLNNKCPVTRLRACI